MMQRLFAWLLKLHSPDWYQQCLARLDEGDPYAGGPIWLEEHPVAHDG